jgi:Spy/CpxP family protein refolding chaperone
MRKTILAVLGTAVLALVVGPATGSAQPPPPGERGPWMGRGEPMARFLGLSEPQQDEVRRLMEDRRADHQALRRIRKSRVAAVVGELAIEAHRLRQQERVLREAQDKAIRELLTAEQRVKFDAMKALREEGMGGPRGGGFGPRPERGPGRQ